MRRGKSVLVILANPEKAGGPLKEEDRCREVDRKGKNRKGRR